MPCADQLSCLQDIDAQLQALVPISTTAAVVVSSPTYVEAQLAGSQSGAFLLGVFMAFIFVMGIRSAA